MRLPAGCRRSWTTGLVASDVTVQIAAKRRSLTNDDRAGTSADREILHSRYANGQIGTEEYSTQLQELQDH